MQAPKLPQRCGSFCLNRMAPEVLQHIQLIIFDLDYVVFDCAGLKLQALRQSLISLADVIPQSIRLPDALDVEELYLEHGARWLNHMELGLGEENQGDFREAYELNESRLIEAGAGALFPGLREFIAECGRNGLPVALGAEAAREYLVSVSDIHQLESLFQISLCTEEFGSGGHEEMLEEIARFLEVNPSEALVLGNRPRLFEAARNMEMLAIGCGWGIQKHPALTGTDLQVQKIDRLFGAVQEADRLAQSRNS